MAIYRPPKARWPLATAFGVAGLVAGLVTGLALGRSDPTPEEAGREIKTVLAGAAASLEVAGVEYKESVQDGEVVNQTEYDGALGALDSSRARYDEVRPVVVSLFPAQVEPIDELYGRVEALMRSKSDTARVLAALERLQSTLEGQTPRART